MKVRNRVFKVYLVDNEGGEWWVYDFSSKKAADSFMKENGISKVNYIVREVVNEY